MYSEVELIKLMADGDQQAFTEIYINHWEALYITAKRVLRGEKEAADIVQDVFLSLWNRRQQLNLEGPLSSYLHTSIRYKCINYIQKNITRRDYLVHFLDVAIIASSPDAEINLHLKEIRETINNTVSKMPAKMQLAYKLSRQEHLSHKEISESMNISVETVKKHIQHALHLIRKNITPDMLILIISLNIVA